MTALECPLQSSSKASSSVMISYNHQEAYFKQKESKGPIWDHLKLLYIERLTASSFLPFPALRLNIVTILLSPGLIDLTEESELEAEEDEGSEDDDETQAVICL